MSARSEHYGSFIKPMPRRNMRDPIPLLMMRSDSKRIGPRRRGRIAAALLVGVSAGAIAFAIVERQAGLVLPADRRDAAVAIVDEGVGATVEQLDGGTARSLGISPRERGLVVTSLARDGPAAQAGVRPSDVIVRIGATPIASRAAAAAALQRARGPVTLTLNRGGHYAIVRLPISRMRPGATPE
jgi:S1-C subfamily serine protease